MECSYPILPSAAPRWGEQEHAWIVTRHADAMRALKSPDLELVEVGGDLRKLSDRLGGAFDTLIGMVETSHPFQNPPAHEAARASARLAVADMLQRWPAERMSALADELLSAAPTGRTVDAADLIADALPRTVAAESLDMTTEELRLLSPHARTILTIWETGSRPLRELREIQASASILRDALSKQNRAIGEHAHDGRHAALAAFLMTAGVEASAGLLGGAIHLLSENEELQARLRRDPSAIPAFVEEVLRFLPPLRRVLARISVRDTEVGGASMKARSWLVVDLESANRDPAVYPEPERFDPDRKRAPVLAFGFGAHACVGSALARLEARIALSRLLERFVVRPGEGQPSLRDSRDWRHYEALPVILEPVAG